MQKTIVKRSPDEPDNDYAAFTAALAKRVYGSNSKIKSIIRDLTVTQKPKQGRKRQTLEETLKNIGDAFNRLFPKSDGMLTDEKRDEIARNIEAFWKNWDEAKAEKAADACPIDKPCGEHQNEYADKICDFLHIDSDFQRHRIKRIPVDVAMFLLDGIEKRLERERKEHSIKQKETNQSDKPCEEQKAEDNSNTRELTLEEKSYLNWEQSDLNDKARAQYEAHKLDMWTCPKCGKAYPWQNGQKGRFAFCFKCNTAGQEKAEQ